MEVPRLLCLLSSAVILVSGFVVLKDKQYIQLHDEHGNKSINASSSNRLAFDPVHSILYVIAKEPRKLTAFILDANDGATLLMEKQFSRATEGQPLDVEMCNPPGSFGSPILAISFLDAVSASADGSVRLYTPLTPADPHLTLIKAMTVGAEPVDMDFGQACSLLMVANRGRPSKVASNVVRDPEGTVTKINLPQDLHDPEAIYVTTTITFGPILQQYQQNFTDMQAQNFRYFPIRNPVNNQILTMMQSMEPERVILAPNGQIAYVSLPKNNAIARIQVEFNSVARIFPLGNRSWTDYHMDPSDTDRSVSLRGYDVYSVSQTTEMLWLQQHDAEWIVTLDTGRLNYDPNYKYADHQRAKILMQTGQISPSSPEMEAKLLDDNELGRLWVSTEDGRNRITGKIENIFAFGGRGFGIRDPNDMGRPTVIVDQIEEVTEQFFKSIFNTGVKSGTDTPQSDREFTSPSLGPELTAMAVGEFEGKTVLFMGGGSSGILYVYMLSPDARCLQPYFHSVHRGGQSSQSWNTAYAAGTIGDVGITDMLYIHSEDIKPVVVVASAFSNSLSFYQVVDEPFN